MDPGDLFVFSSGTMWGMRCEWPDAHNTLTAFVAVRPDVCYIFLGDKELPSHYEVMFWDPTRSEVVMRAFAGPSSAAEVIRTLP